MKVSELIEQLQGYDPDLEISFPRFGIESRIEYFLGKFMVDDEPGNETYKTVLEMDVYYEPSEANRSY